MPPDWSDTQLNFEGFAGRQVVGAFDGGAVTSNAGALLLREADRVIGLTAKVARYFRDSRDPDSVIHGVPALVGQRIHGLALGYKDINDHAVWHHDPVLGLLSDTMEPKRRGVATRITQIDALYFDTARPRLVAR
jgi:Transposase DDE domain group 1